MYPSDDDDSLAQLARRGQKRRMGARVKQELAEAKEAREWAFAALRPLWPAVLFGAGAVIITAVVVLSLTLVFDFLWLLLIGFLTLIACSALAYVLSIKLGNRLALAWLDNRPFEFDRDAYLELLGKWYNPGTSLEARLHFRSPPQSADKQVLADACLALLPEGSTSDWDWENEPNVMLVRSPFIKTTVDTGPENRAEYPENSDLHAWFKVVAERLASALASRVSVARISVETR